MAGKYLTQLLERLDLLSNNSVFFTSKKSRYAPVFAPEVQNKLEIIKPDAFYSFNNQPYILFFDLSDESDTEREDQIHRQVWSFDSAPVIFVIKKADIEVYNAFYYQKNRNRLERLSADEDEIIKQFSFWNVQSGSTWQWLQAEKYKDTINKKRVNQRLFDNIKAAREHLEETGLSTSDANITILRLIFIRYLIDRGVGIKKEFISGETVHEKRKSLSDLIQNASKLSKFFKYLNERFNGTLFKQNSPLLLKSNQCSFLSQIFDVRKDKVSPSLFDSYYFDVFDFSIIPVEVISGIYESVIDDEIRDKDSAIYTPPFLVEYILSETVDNFFNKRKKTECKVLDPACGSGIFLVQSYRRMVDEEMRRNKISSIESGRLRDIAENNLYGIDLNEQALLVASFSIYIAILDYKEPKEINTFKFPNLIGKNLFAANFFNTKHEYNDIFKKIDFDFILGNPPWKNGSKDKIHLQYLNANNLLNVISDYQLAQSFIIRVRDFSNLKTICSLVITSKAIYNNNADNFRKYFLKNFYLHKCFDLSAVRRLIFEGADNPAMILNFQNANGESTREHIVEHSSLKYNLYLKYYRALVIEKNDKKQIKQHLFLDYQWMFKVALYGGIMDFLFLKRLINCGESLENVLNNKYYIETGNGIHKGSADTFYSDLVGLPVIETNTILQYYTPVTDRTKKLMTQDAFLERGRSLSLFKGNKILFTRRPKKETYINISLCTKDAVFRNSAYGIAVKDNNELLAQLYTTFISDLFTYYQYLTTSNWGIYHPEINKTEYLSFPFVEVDKEMIRKIESLFTQFLNPFLSRDQEFNFESHYREELIFKEINNTINQLYSISLYERDLIDYVLNISVHQFQGDEKQKLITDFTYLNEDHYRNQTHTLTQYADVFIQEFNHLYNNESLQIDIYILSHFIAMNFSFSGSNTKKAPSITFNNNVDIKTFFDKISSLSISKIINATDPFYNLFIQKDIKGFEKDSFYIIKPNEYKCWHRAMAWHDVAEVKELIEAAEVETLIESK